MNKFLKLFCLFVFLLSAFLLVTYDIKTIEAAETYPFTGIISADALVTYTSNNTGGSKATELAYGTRVTVVDSPSNKKSGGCSLYEILYDNNKTGYVCSKYVNNVSESILSSDASGTETYNDYCNTLTSTGFDKSYCPYLYYLHTIHPNWTFKPDVLNLTMETAAAKEEWKVVLQTSNSNYWISSKPIEGSYYYIDQTVISSFLDPRNSLFEDTIFQFLNLEKSKDIYNDAAMKKISSTSGNLYKYLSTFKEAANEFSINPIHIMARSKQEGANDSSYSAITGKYTTTKGRYSLQGYSLDGYYNFYNIGSYADSNYSYTVQRGLAYAAGFLESDKCFTTSDGKTYYDSDKCGQLSIQRPWNTPQKSIKGGAEFLVNNYISRAQNTVYYQKFNITNRANNDGKLYTNQYMTGIAAPMSEAKTLYSAYKEGNLLDSNFEFIIPVFKNMPAEVSQALDRNSDTSLTTIKVDGKVITGFDLDVIEYNYNAITDSDTINIEAKPLYSTSSVTGTGEYKFENGKVQVKLVVTSEGGNSKTYVVNISKVSPSESVTTDEIVSKIGTKVNGDNMYGISPDTSVTTIINTITKNKGTAKITNSENQNKTTGSLATGDKITIEGTNDSKTYTISVRGDVTGDGLVKINDLILIQSHILDKSKLEDEQFYAADSSYDNNIKINDLILVQSHILGKQSL